MIYFLYTGGTSFKKAKSLENLKSKASRIIEEEKFNKHFAKGDNLYCFVNPYLNVIDGEKAIDWALSEGEAWDKFYASSDAI